MRAIEISELRIGATPPSPIEAKTNPVIQIPEEFLRGISTAYIASRSHAERRQPDEDSWDASLAGREEVQAFFLSIARQRHIVEKPNNHPFVKPLEITLEQVDSIAAFYTSVRSFYVHMDFGSTGLANVTPLEARTHAKMTELAKILFGIGQGDRVLKADEEAGKSKSELEREKLVREAPGKKGLH